MAWPALCRSLTARRSRGCSCSAAPRAAAQDDAALLAVHGYARPRLAYYGVPGLPATLEWIPLEYFAA